MHNEMKDQNQNPRVYERVLVHAQSYFQSLVEPDVSIVDELLAARRAEAARELKDA